MNEEMKEIVSDVLGDGNWKIFVGLDTNYHCKTSPSYFDSMFYAFYKNTSEQLTFQGASGEKQINVFVAMWVFLALAIVMLVLIGVQTGRRPEDDEIHPVLMDRFPIELLMLKDIILWTLLVVLYGTGFACVSRNSSYYYSMLPQVTENVMVRCAICGVLATALFAWNLKSYGRRIKEGKLGGSILASIAHAIKRTVDASRKTIQNSYRAQKANRQLLIAYIVLLGVQTIFMWIICAFGFHYAGGMAFFFFLLMILFDIFVYLKMLKSTSGKEAIKDGIQQLAAGNLDYRINTEHMSGENLELAEEINEGNMDERVGILHKSCGKIRKTILTEAIWMQKRCGCEKWITFEDASRRVRTADPGFSLIRYIGGRKDHIVLLKHEVCGQTFQWELSRFEKRPTCMACGRRRAPRNSPEDFRERMRELAGDEYEPMSGFTDLRSRILIRHRACGTVTEMIPNDFLRGRRCNLCHKAIRRTELEEALNTCTGGYYRITDMKNVRYCIEGENGERFFRDSGCIMQELSRPTESKLFTHRLAKPKPIQRKEAMIYLSAKEICRRKGFWSPRDSADILPLKQVQDLIRWLVRNDYLERIGYGEYVLSEKKLPGEHDGADQAAESGTVQDHDGMV
mgnify:CR=1 FL=1